MNIRARLTLLFVLLVASILLLFSVFTFYQYSQFREQEYYQRLAERVKTALRLHEDLGASAGDGLPSLADESISIYNSANQRIYTSGKKALTLDTTQLNLVRSGRSLRLKQGTHDLMAVRYVDERNRVLVGAISAYDRYGFSKLDRLRQILGLGFLLGLLAVGLAGWIFAGDALRPVSEIITQVNTISATNMHDRLRIRPQPDELTHLARTFNSMLNRLEDAFVSQRSFVSHASHELRTPLTVMMGQIEVALMQARSPAEYQTTLENVLEEVQKMTKLVNGLLELARANSDAAMLPFAPVRIDELLWQSRSALLAERPDFHIDIEYGTLPENEEDLITTGDESLLRTAFRNLMENSCKYSPDQRTSVTLQVDDSKMLLSFRDYGYGIAPTDLPHIFEPFYRSEDTHGITGHGIGLALTRRIIDIHRGHIDVESQLGKGTIFTISFSRRSDPNAPLPFGSVNSRPS